MPSKSVTRKFTNISTEGGFQFIFHCDRCGAGVKSERYEFNNEPFDPEPRGRAHTLLWTRQHDEAYERANNEAGAEFNYCSVCGRRVCNACFYVSSEAVTDICIDCKRARDKSARRELRKHKFSIFKWLGGK